MPAIAAWKWESIVFGGSVHSNYFDWSVRFFISVELTKKGTKCTIWDEKSKKIFSRVIPQTLSREGRPPTNDLWRFAVDCQRRKNGSNLSDTALPVGNACCPLPPTQPSDPWRIGLAIPDPFSNPGISGLWNTNPGIPGLVPGLSLKMIKSVVYVCKYISK